jgi:hypothetical protein
MRFQKRQAKLRWFAYFGQMTNIRGWSQVPDDEHFFVCGDYLTDDTASDLVTARYTGAVARMKNDGEVRWYVSITGTNPSGSPDQDRCMGVAYNPETFNVAVMVQGKMSQIRANSKGNFYDQILFLLDQQGDVDHAMTVTQGSLSYDMYSASQGIFNKRGTYQDEHYYYAGWSYGFETKYQKLDPVSYPEVKDSANLDYDTYVYYADFNLADDNNCLYQEEVSSSDARRRLDKTSQSAIDNSASSFE